MLFLRAWYVRRELRRLKSRITNHESIILDAGMGFGQYFDRMNRMFKGAGLVGLELDRKHLYGSEKYFREVHPQASIVIGDVQILPFSCEKFDLILTVDVMEHVEDDRAAFSEYFRVLKPGGYMVMHTPRVRGGELPPPESPPAEQGGRTGSNPPLPPPTSQGGRASWQVGEHVRDGYRDSEARERFESAGLETVRLVRGYGSAGRAAWTLLQRIPLSWLSKGKLMLLPTTLYMIPAFPIGLLLMIFDYLKGDNPQGGSLLVVARRPEEA
ncbi:methyltransferase domain-containing protein [bacterium]|nr:methyltransferase domain-containing protein [bacterium]